MARTDIQQVDQPDTDADTADENGRSNRNSFTSQIHGLPVKRVAAVYQWPAEQPVAEITQRDEGYVIRVLATGRESNHRKVSEVYAVLNYLNQA